MPRQKALPNLILLGGSDVLLGLFPGKYEIAHYILRLSSRKLEYLLAEYNSVLADTIPILHIKSMAYSE